jgi:hypothetical protein
MALLVPDVGEVVLLNSMIRTTTPESQTLKLYSNNITPAEGDTAATYTESVAPGYAAVALTRGTWTGAATAAGVTTSTYPQQTFSFTGTGTIYGYFIVGTTSTILLWSELMFSGGQVFNNLDQYKLTLLQGLD